MTKLAEIKKLLKMVVDANPNYPISGTVTKVDGETVSVKIASGLVISDVRLKATVSDDQDFLLLTPAIGSDVLILSNDGTLSGLTVIKCDKIDKFQFHQSGLKVEFDGTDQKVMIKNDQASLKDIFSDLSELLKQLKVYTPAGVSGIPIPDSILRIEAFETKFKQLLK